VRSASEVALAWTAVPGATGYRIEWDAGVGTSARSLRATTVVPRYVEEYLIPGQYRYWVQAVGPGGVSEPALIVVQAPFEEMVPILPR
jgi:hypothetical protein